ncbi:hypothetical protein AK812_SmicGene14917 [Symbiodinium microadriaticum]|uniref:E3 ubiquitin-protein ligase HERC2 n=1 Tax=Symbiodinium microadriaticum TaxID=2951 RepID=A0A1Q9E4A1_SYMMI|nr:hypothetical protein AK812_SmicGene14917 [Symbiodinium microadriaticum]
MLGDGSVVTRGIARFGGDSSSVRGQLKDVQLIKACGGTFAAILMDVSIDKLQNAQQIQASGAAFAVILDFHDGSVVTWGQGEACGHGTLKNVQQIHASVVSFAATLGSGSVLTWGDSTKVQAKALAGKDWLFMDYGRAGLDSEGACLVMAVQGFSTNSDTGTGLTRPVYWQRGAWAMIVKAGSSELALSGLLYGPEQTPAAADRMASAVIAEHTRVDWGSRLHLRQLKNVQQIQASDSAFAAILGDGSVVTWGNPEYGGDSSSVQDQLKNVRQIRASGGAFAAILSDGSIVTWGPASNGGDSSSMQDTNLCAIHAKRVTIMPKVTPKKELQWRL